MKKKNRYIGKFVATNRSAKSYKSINTRIYAIYKRNKELIDQTLTGNNKFSTPYEKFKNKIKSYMKEDNLTFDEALRSYGKSRVFTSKEELGLSNIKLNLHKNESTQLRKILGYKKKINWEGFTWNKERKMYIDASNTVGLVFNYTDDSEKESIVSIVQL